MPAPFEDDLLALIRLATPDDEEALVAMVRDMYADPGFGGMTDAAGRRFEWAEDKTRAIIQRATVRNRNEPEAGQAWIGIVGVPGIIKGSAYVEIRPCELSYGAFLGQLWSWVRPEHRHEREVTDALLAFSVTAASELHLSLGAAAVLRPRPAQARFFERVMGKAVASVYNYSPAAGE
jgi:hypothetical protein